MQTITRDDGAGRAAGKRKQLGYGASAWLRACGMGLAVWVGLADTAVGQQTLRERIGYDRALARLGASMPTGAGVVFGHVEGQAGAYRPDLTGRPYESVAFTLRSGPSEPSSHATQTAQVIYGQTGLAPGVEVVHVMTAGDYLGAQGLRADTHEPPMGADEEPTAFQPRVYTHSWIGDPPEGQAARVLRRVDYQVDTRDVLVVAGVNNGAETPVPSLLGSAYNAIAVGAVSGASSGGGTRVEGAGRSKPDVVAANGLTSFATPVVAACAALVLEQGDRLVAAGHAEANRSEVVKAALMGAAVKPTGWTAAAGRSLDDHLGAGEINLDRALRIMARGPAEAGETIKTLYGWAYPTVERGGVAGFDLRLPVDTGPVTFTAVWHRRIDGRTAVVRVSDTGERRAFWIDAPRLADVDLRIVSVDQEAEGGETVVAQSVSQVDNVEHVTLDSLAKGAYRVELWRDPERDRLEEGWEVALTWTIERP
ncbi:MAG: S8 family serine peptidase [Planctomycetota bacterium]